ncbi:MAG: regulatory protein RecX [Gemmatimonadota bacterium]
MAARARRASGKARSPAERDPESPLELALRHLAVRTRSRAELERHLRRRGVPPESIPSVVEHCAELGYVDDRAFAAAFVRDRIRLRPRGIARLRSELRAKGVDAEDAEAGIRMAFEELGVTEGSLLEAAAAGRWRALRALAPPVRRRRLAAYLLRRGFPPPDVRRVVAGLSRDEAAPRPREETPPAGG